MDASKKMARAVDFLIHQTRLDLDAVKLVKQARDGLSMNRMDKQKRAQELKRLRKRTQKFSEKEILGEIKAARKTQ